MTFSLDISAMTLQDALAAERGGAASVEVIADLAARGLTPPFDLVRAVREHVQIGVNVIVRPHNRDFCYTPTEIDRMLEDAARFAELGINSLVIGGLDAAGDLDLSLIERVRAAAPGVAITVHQAIDASRDPGKAVAALEGRVERALTSGGAATAWLGRDNLRAWVQAHGERLRFACAAGIDADHLAALAAHVRAPEYHVGHAARTGGAVDVDRVKRLVACLAGL